MENMKQKIRSGATVVGFGARYTFEPDDFKKVAEQGIYDFAFTDSQHSPYSEDRLVRLAAMAADCGLPLHFRIKHTRHGH